MEFLSIFGWNFAELTKFEKHSFQFYIQGYLHLKWWQKKTPLGVIHKLRSQIFGPFEAPLPLLL